MSQYAGLLQMGLANTPDILILREKWDARCGQVGRFEASAWGLQVFDVDARRRGASLHTSVAAHCSQAVVQRDGDSN